MKTPIRIDILQWLPQHPWHPSVVYIADSWNEYRWWMAETPYPPFDVKPYRDRWELPCIHYSNDGVHCESAGAPIDELTEQQIASHSDFSDPHLVMKDGVLYCYYRQMDDYDAKTTIIRKHTLDGVHWSEREVVIVERGKRKDGEQEIISPAIVWTGEKWRMYYVDDTFTNLEREIQMAESEDGVHFEYVGPVWERQKIIPWHIDVQLIDGMYYLLVHDVDNRTLILYDSEDGLKWYNGKELLKASGKLLDFWSHKLYRACIVKANNRMQVYFSATDGMASYIGKMGQCATATYKVLDCFKGEEKGIFVMRFMYRRCKQFIQRVIHFIAKRI